MPAVFQAKKPQRALEVNEPLGLQLVSLLVLSVLWLTRDSRAQDRAPISRS